MLLEEIHRALPPRLGARFVEAPTLIAMESVLRACIDVDLAVAAALLLDHFHVAHRNRCILVAEMHLRGYLPLLVGVLGDLPAVIADRGRKAVELAGGEESNGAAHAEAHDGDWAFLLQLVDRGLRVAEHRAPIGIGDEFARVGDFVRRIDRWSRRGVALPPRCRRKPRRRPEWRRAPAGRGTA